MPPSTAHAAPKIVEPLAMAPLEMAPVDLETSSLLSTDLNNDGKADGILRVAVYRTRSYLDSLPEGERTVLVTFMGLLIIPIVACCISRVFVRCCCPGAQHVRIH